VVSCRLQVYFFRCVGVIPAWDKYWSKATDKANKAKEKVSIVKTLIYAFGPAYALSAVLQLIYSVLQFASPQIVNLLIDFVQSEAPQWQGYFYTILICLVTMINTVVNSQCFFQEYVVGLRVKTALISAIYRKSVKLSNTGRSEMTGHLKQTKLSNSKAIICFFHFSW
jgi:ATP-binding cassette subfamily C (CFTR/MRP) protein 1